MNDWLTDWEMAGAVCAKIVKIIRSITFLGFDKHIDEIEIEHNKVDSRIEKSLATLNSDPDWYFRREKPKGEKDD